MKRLLFTFFIVTCLHSSFAQSTSQESLKRELIGGLYSGCVEKQSQSQLATNSEFTADVCSCYAKNSTEQIFSNLDFQIALKKKDDLAMKSAIGQVINKENSTVGFQYCLNKTHDKFKENKKPILDKPNKELSTKRGLIGESRDSQARLLLGKQYGDKNVVSISHISLDEQQSLTATPSELKHEKVVNYLTNKITRIKNRPKVTQQDVHKAVERYKTRQKRANLELEKQQELQQARDK